jgi:general secretion pathway protein I
MGARAMMPTSRAGTSRVEAPARGGAFTLIEVLAALAIVSIALLGLLQLHLVSLRMADTAQTTALAVLLAQEKIAEATACGPAAVGAASGTTEIDGSRFTWRTEVSNVDSLASYGLAGNRLRQLRVDVVWRDGARPGSVQMTTYLADSKIP